MGCAGTRTPTDMECRSQKSLVSSMHDLIGVFFSFQKMKSFSFIPMKRNFVTFLISLCPMKRVHHFRDFAMERLGREPLSYKETVDTCLQAMHEGVLDVCVQNTHCCNVWIWYGMTADQWHCVCGLLQRAGIASSILWDPIWFVYEGFMADIEYLWTDLKAVEKFLECRTRKPVWVVQELGRRQTWNAGLRRAWLAACTI